MQPMTYSEAEETAMRDLRDRKSFVSEEAMDRYLIACWRNHQRAPRSAYRAGPALSPLASAGCKVEHNLRYIAMMWEGAATARAEARCGA